MRFAIRDSLLSTLHARREQQRASRPPRPVAEGANFMEHVKTMFAAGNPDPKAIADRYVAAMGSWQDEIEREHDAFLLDPGMGPMLYLTSDGRVLSDGRGWDGEGLSEVVSDGEAISAIVVGAKKTGIVELLELLPRKPEGAADCRTCHGERFAAPAPSSGHDQAQKFVCWDCRGRGFITD